jgi:hypothetical protein
MHYMSMSIGQAYSIKYFLKNLPHTFQPAENLDSNILCFMLFLIHT